MQRQNPFQNQTIENNKNDQTRTEYYCACQTFFNSPEDFKHHILKAHQGTFVQGSSHYITKFTQTVIPTKSWHPSSLQQPTKTLKISYSDQNQQLSQPQLNQNLISLAVSNKNRRKLKRGGQNNRIQEVNACALEERRFQEKQLRSSGKQENSMVWNGFKLVPNKTNLCEVFFCGNCRITLNSVQQFIIHCFDQCKQLQHPDSSHSIALAEPQEVNALHKQDQMLETSTLDASNQQFTRKTRINRKKKDVPAHLVKIYQHLRKQTREQESLICGCGKVLIHRQYLKHMVVCHNQIVPKGSSHIVLRHYSAKYVSVLLSLSSFDETLGWSCPCRPLVNMTGLEFARHIMYIHKGISLQYSLKQCVRPDMI